ncbi:MAG: NAD(P)/FAD-dependent oxidoreductase [Bryobacteraceae bacterium]|nr:NAD(P)/FAD-dependent oxidoreductase [Bryobacteraceae bacterium]
MNYDAIIVGGSYAGLSAAMQIARAGRKVCIIDAGQPRNRFAAASHGFFGQDGVPPRQMIADAQAKLKAYPAVTMLDGVAKDACPEPNGFRITLESGETVEATKLVLAFGLIDVLPTIPGLAERWGRTVLHCPYCHGYELRGKQLGVLSVAALSVHQALMIPDWGPTTFFLNGQAQPDELSCAKLAQRNVSIESQPVVGLEGQEPELSGVRLADGRLVQVAALYLGSQTRMASSLAEHLGCAFDDGPFGPIIRTDAARLTTVPGVYAAGDIARVPHNATWASADGVTAGSSLHQALIFEPLAALS